MTRLQNMALGVLLRLIHWIIDLLYKLREIIKIGKKFKSYWTARSTCYDLLSSRTCYAKILKRVPKHIGIIVTEETISYADISNIVVWCMTMGITFISIYDHDGIIKRNKDAFHSQLLETKSKYLGKETSRFKIDMNAVKLNGTVNGYKNTELIVVNILSHTDGRQHLAQAASEICQEVSQRLTSSADIKSDVISEYLQRECNVCRNIPDPDLILRFGMVSSTLGFLPWHIRLSEILSLPSHHNVSYEDFCKVLLRFSICEQRCGK